MKRLVLLAVLPLVGAAAAPEFSPAAVRAHVAFLADDLLEGRGTGTRGHEIAARYVAAQFASYGLQPGAKDGSWFQQVRLQEQRPGATPATLTISGAAGAKTWEQGSDVLVGTSSRDAVTDVEAPVVFVGYGIDAPKQGYDDYAGLDVRGKIVAFLSGSPVGPPDEVLAHLAHRSVKARMAALRGAVGVLTLPTPAGDRRSPWARSVAASGIPTMTFVAGDGKPFDTAPAIRASALLNRAAADALFAGARKPYAAVYDEAGAAGGRPKGLALATRVRITATAQFRTVTSPNVIGVLPGSDPKLKSEVVVLMAHLDHLGMRDDLPGDKIYNGALDNAAGIATMLEVARAFGETPDKPKRTLMFVANTAEEKGLLGAEALANDPPLPIGDFAAVVDLDQPMLLYDFTDVIAFGGDHSTMGDAVRRAAAKADITVSPDPMPEQAIFTRSDHYTFAKRGVPALLLATGFANGGKAAWEDYLATRYHQPSDDMNQPINWAAGAKYARVNYLITRELADAPARPRWYAGDYFGATFAPGAPVAARPKER